MGCEGCGRLLSELNLPSLTTIRYEDGPCITCSLQVEESLWCSLTTLATLTGVGKKKVLSYQQCPDRSYGEKRDDNELCMVLDAVVIGYNISEDIGPYYEDERNSGSFEEDTWRRFALI